MKNMFKIISLAALSVVSIITIPSLHTQYLFNKVAKKSFKPFMGNGSGSSFLIKNDAGKTITLTNYHVCRGLAFFENQKLYVNMASSLTGKVSKRQVLAMSILSDVCALTSENGEEGLSMASGYSPLEQVYVVGHPLGHPIQLASGHIISKFETHVIQLVPVAFFFLPIPVLYNALLINTHAAPGNSGSAVVNRFGNVVGILFAGDSRVDYQSFIIPLEQVKKFVNSIK